jgi:hypothetical protein
MHAAVLAAFFCIQTSRVDTAMPVSMFLENNS